MNSKQDRTAARTPSDLERKYRFGVSFAELIGLVNDSRDKVDSVESSLRSEITQSESRLARSDSEIAASVSEVTKITEKLSDSVNGVNDKVTELTSKVEMKLDADSVDIIIEKKLESGVDKVETKTGYVFGSDGMDIAKSGEEISNLMDHTGMYVKKNRGLSTEEDVLIANNKGVKATDLHAKTYLIIGAGEGRSRFEDYGTNRTACYWVGD